MSGRDASHRDVGVIWLDADGRLRRVNDTVRAWSGDSVELQQLLPLLDARRWQDWAAQGFATVLSLGLRQRNGALMLVQAQLEPAPDGGYLLCLWSSLRTGERAAIDALQRSVLRAVATAQPLGAVMDLLCREVESLAPEVVCSVLLVDAEGRLHPLAGPSLPPAYSEALEGAAIGPQAGSCGTAAWRREAVEVSSIASDPLWANYKHLALAHGLAACWSTPILLDEGSRVAATFALYYRQEQAIADYHRHLVNACTQLVRVALLHHEHEARIERLAYFDGITGLPNRALFLQRADAHLRRLRDDGEPAALLLMDLDRFKAVNEVQGHAVGNEVLRRVAQQLARCLPGQDTLARLGDDEFVVLLPRADRAVAAQTADAICAALAEPLQLSRGQPLRIGVSVGWSAFPGDGEQPEALLKHADIALNHAKLAGRHCARGFNAAMASELQEKAWLEAELQQALQRHELQLHFQPKLCLASGALLGAEVLLRWPHAERGFIAPDHFIPLAEEIGLISEIDAWVLEAACAQLQAWRADGLALPALAVNVSAPRFQHADVVAHLQALLQRHELAPQAITLEVTERLMLDETQDRRAVAQLQQLRAMGVGVSIDDFGTGYSSLSYLRRLPISELKIDRSFVNNLVDNSDDQALTAALVTMAQALKLRLVAEGVETQAQAELLLQLGCEAAQGYWLSRPLAAPAFAAWCRARSR